MSSQKIITQGEYTAKGLQFENNIRESDYRLRTDEYIVIHVDGVKFTSKYLHNMSLNELKECNDALVEAAKSICCNFDSIRLAYVSNDEVVFLLAGKYVETNYHNRIQKLSSIFAAKLTLEFNKKLETTTSKILKNLKSNAYFASKCFNLSASIVNDYFKWRLLACKKSIFDNRHNFDKTPDWKKFGTLIVYENSSWQEKYIDFEKSKLIKTPQNEFYNIE